MNKNNIFSLILQEGEGYKIEFKEKVSGLDREMVAFANSAGGSIFLGITDTNDIKGIQITNKLKSQILDIARNCDPPVQVELIAHDKILEIKIPEGQDKPYRCNEGFFLRIGPNSQKLKRDEIIHLIRNSNKIHFDEAINHSFQYPRDFSEDALELFLKHCNIHTKLPAEDVLFSLNTTSTTDNKIQLNNAGVLFFAKEPQRFYPEAYITAVKYTSQDRFSILDRQDIFGSPIEQIEQAMRFLLRNMHQEAVFVSQPVNRVEEGPLGQRLTYYEYPLVALREAIVNAVTHRDYDYDGSHIYLHLYPDHLDIENPGGLYRGLTLDSLGTRSARRNRLIADLLYRAHYIERIGSGFDRMKRALLENNNPPLEVNATNFFNIRFYKRIPELPVTHFTRRQTILYHLFQERKTLTKKEASIALKVSEDSALRDIKYLIDQKIIIKTGTGKNTAYMVNDDTICDANATHLRRK